MTMTGAEVGAERSGRAGLDDATLLAVLGGLPDPAVVIDATGHVLWGNAAAERFFGRSLASSLGMSGLDLVHPDDLDFAMLSLASVQTKTRGLPIEVRLRSTTGWRLAEVIGAPLAGSAAGALILSFRDLTKRRSFEVAGDDDAKFRSLVHYAAALTMLVSADGTVDSASGALPRLLGQDPSEVVGGPLEALVDPADHDALRGALAASAAGPPGAARAPVVEVRLRHASEGPIPFELTIVNLLDEPTVRGFVVSGHDQTARKAIEEELLSTLSLLSATLDSTGDGILVVDLHGAITSYNRRFVEMWKLPEELLLSRDDAAAIDFVLGQLDNPAVFLEKVTELYAHPEAESHDVLHFADGRVFDRYSQPQYVDGEIVGRVWCFRDSTDRARLEAQLAHQALHDSLTGLANQSLFRDRVEHSIERLDRGEGHVAVLFLDLDNFKDVNDSLGHSAGDRLLVEVAQRLERCLRSRDSAARLGGDEFAILLEDLHDDREAVQVADRILSAFREPFALDGTNVSTSVSIGIASGALGMASDQLLRNADLAMYAAKRTGKARYESYRADMHATAVRRLHADADLRRGVEREEIVPYYQPIVDLVSGEVVALEALARWMHPTHGVLSADAFISLAEEIGLIDDIGYTILDRACADLSRWSDAGIAPPDLRISVNLAPRQLEGEGLYGTVVAALATNRLDPSRLIVEITEGALMRDTESAISTLRRLRDLGIQVAVDDFGTGYSSLSYLQRFPIDILKIDKSFTDQIDPGSGHSALPEAIVALAGALGLVAIAEGVESEWQRLRLLELGCDQAQGYRFAAPMAADAMELVLEQRGGTSGSA